MSEEQGELSLEQDAPIADSSTAQDSATEQNAEGVSEVVSEPKKVNKVQERINQLTREKYELRQQLQGQEDRLRALETRPTAEKVPLKAPNEDDFSSDVAFQAANSKYITETATEAAYQRFTSENLANQEAQSQAFRQQELVSKKKTFDDNLAAKAANFEDFDNVAYGHQFMDQDIAEQIFEMDKGPEVAYHLGSNLDVAEKIFSLTPVQRARELTKLEFQVETLSPKKVSNAPDPINPLGSQGTGSDKDPDSMTADEWHVWRCKQLNIGE